MRARPLFSDGDGMVRTRMQKYRSPFKRLQSNGGL